MLALAWWTMFRRLLFVFRISPKTSGEQIVVNHSELTVLRCSSGTAATWPVLQKNQATICNEVILPQPTFVGFSLDSKSHSVDCCFVSDISLICQLWRSYKRLLQHHHRIFPTFLYANRHEPFFEWMSNCAASNDKKSFLRPGVHAMVEKMSKDASISRYVTWRSGIGSSRTASRLSGTTAVLGGPSRISSLSQRRSRLN